MASVCTGLAPGVGRAIFRRARALRGRQILGHQPETKFGAAPRRPGPRPLKGFSNTSTNHSTRRRAAGYNPASLKAYRPNETFYLSREQRENLLDIGTVRATGKSAKGYPDRTTKRLLTDLSWNSSRLEGNSYSLLETETPDQSW